MSPKQLLDAYEQYMRQRSLAELTRYNRRADARRFLRWFPDPESFTRLSPSAQQKKLIRDVPQFVAYLALQGTIKLSYSQLFRGEWGFRLAAQVPGSRHEQDIKRIRARLERLGYRNSACTNAINGALLRVLAKTAKRMAELTVVDFDELRAHSASLLPKSRQNLRSAIRAAHTALFHEYIVDELPPVLYRSWRGWKKSIQQEVVQPAMRKLFLRYLDQRSLTLKPGSVSAYSMALRDLSQYLATHYPEVRRVSELKRHPHIESYLHYLTSVPSRRRGAYPGEKLGTLGRNHRLGCLRTFFDDLRRWGWRRAPRTPLLLKEDIPRRPDLLPRALSPDADGLLRQSIDRIDDPLARDAVRLLRGSGIRVGELVALRADCLEVDANGCSWLRVPPQKLDKEHLIPLDPETAQAVARLQALRNDARRSAIEQGNRPVDTDRLLLRYGHPVDPQYIRVSLYGAAESAGLQAPPGHRKAASPHRLRHTYATELINAGMDTEELMQLLGHVSPQMTMHYARISPQTLRDRYYEALSRLPQPLLEAANFHNERDFNRQELIRLLRLASQRASEELQQTSAPTSTRPPLVKLQKLLSELLSVLEV